MIAKWCYKLPKNYSNLERVNFRCTQTDWSLKVVYSRTRTLGLNGNICERSGWGYLGPVSSSRSPSSACLVVSGCCCMFWKAVRCGRVMSWNKQLNGIFIIKSFRIQRSKLHLPEILHTHGYHGAWYSIDVNTMPICQTIIDYLFKLSECRIFVFREWSFFLTRRWSGGFGRGISSLLTLYPKALSSTTEQGRRSMYL